MQTHSAESHENIHTYTQIVLDKRSILFNNAKNEDSKSNTVNNTG